MGVRRVVTGHDQAGKAVFMDDELVAPVTLALMPGMDFHRLWGADAPRHFPDDGSKPEATTYFPPLGGFRFGLFTIPPDDGQGSLTTGTSDPALVELEDKLPGLARYVEPDNPGMHTTATIDYGILLSGQAILELDDGATTILDPGDTYVQNGTRHRWSNKGDVPAVFAVTLIGATTTGGLTARGRRSSPPNRPSARSATLTSRRNGVAGALMQPAPPRRSPRSHGDGLAPPARRRWRSGRHRPTRRAWSGGWTARPVAPIRRSPRPGHGPPRGPLPFDHPVAQSNPAASSPAMRRPVSSSSRAFCWPTTAGRVTVRPNPWWSPSRAKLAANRDSGQPTRKSAVQANPESAAYGRPLYGGDDRRRVSSSRAASW